MRANLPASRSKQHGRRQLLHEPHAEHAVRSDPLWFCLLTRAPASAGQLCFALWSAPDLHCLSSPA